MGIFREIPPTAGWQVYAGDLGLLKKTDTALSLGGIFQNFLCLPYAQTTYSGTAAFFFILQALKEISHKKTVVIPSFICPLIPLAVKRAGLIVKICDIQPDNFNFNWEQLKEILRSDLDILAIAAVHLAGIPLDFAALEQIARRYRISIIEDCAQSLGALYHGKPTGSQGDFAFFSLCRGKGLSIYEGGIVACRERQSAALIQQKINQLANNDYWSEAIKILELYGYWLFYRPEANWLIFSLPRIFWESLNQPLRAQAEFFDANFPLHRVSLWRQVVACRNFSRLEIETCRQRQIAQEYIRQLKDLPGLKIVGEPAGSLSNYPYLTLIFDDRQKKTSALKLLRKKGLGASEIYAMAITDYDYLKDITAGQSAPAACHLAKHHLTLSTSSFLRKSEIDSIVEIIKNI